MDPFDAYFSPQAKAAAPVAKDAFDAYFGAPTKAEAIKTEVKAATPRQGMTEALAQPAGSGFDDAMAGASFRTADDIVRALASGASFGLIDKGAAAANALLGRGDYASNVREELGRSRQFEEENPAVSLPAQLIGSLASGALLGGPLMAMRGPTVAKTIIGGGGAGAAGAFGGAEGTPEEQASETGKGALAGAALGAALPVVGNVALRGAQAVGRGVDPGIQALARRAEELGIPLSGAQISPNQFGKYMESSLDKLPFVYKGAPGQQNAAFTQAVSRTFGENTPKITTEVMANAKTRIGEMFDDVAKKSMIVADDKLLGGLKGIEAQIDQVPGLDRPAFKNLIDDITKRAENGVISGKTYQDLIRRGSPLDSAMKSESSSVRYYAGEIRDKLDDALERSAPPEVVEKLRTARLQYKNMKTIEDLAEKADASGQISPSLLLNRVRQSYQDFAYTGAGELGDLARIGQQFLKEPPNSGTPQRLIAMGSLLGAGAPASGAFGPGAAVGAIGAIGAGNVARMAINSDVYRNALMGKYGPALTQELNQRMIQAGVLGGGLLGQSRGQ